MNVLTEFEKTIEELKSITHNRATDLLLWLHVSQLADGRFTQSWTFFFTLYDGIKHQISSYTYDDLKRQVAEAAGLSSERCGLTSPGENYGQY